VRLYVYVARTMQIGLCLSCCTLVCFRQCKEKFNRGHPSNRRYVLWNWKTVWRPT